MQLALNAAPAAHARQLHGQVAAAACPLTRAAPPSARVHAWSRCVDTHPRPASLQPRCSTHITRAAAVDVVPQPPFAGSSRSSSDTTFEFACPICQTTHFSVSMATNPYQRLSCPRCNRTFDAASNYLDLTLTSGVSQTVFKQRLWRGTELFRQPAISFIYERGWRQNFAQAGFPGPDKEFATAMDYFAPVLGGTLVDASCGTGLFTRKFALSGQWAGVVALDFSESMLQQAQTYFKEDAGLATSTPIVAVRADVGRLPFATGSVDAIHAGAAMHCWPNPQAAMAEISRVLRPGGVFVASTFLNPFAPLGELVGDSIVRPLSQNFNPFNDQGAAGFRYWEEAELQDLAASVGLGSYQRIRSRMFILFSVTKPSAGAV